MISSHIPVVDCKHLLMKQIPVMYTCRILDHTSHKLKVNSLIPKKINKNLTNINQPLKCSGDGSKLTYIFKYQSPGQIMFSSLSMVKSMSI